MCIKNIFLTKKLNKDEIIKSPENETCHLRTVKSIGEELYKRFILPFYTLIISLVGASLVIEPKSRYLTKFHKLNIFLIGIGIIILSQLSLKFFLDSINLAYLILLMPFILILIFYFFLLLFTKFRLNFL
tara:strand:+ start:14 stop:403 length:390 start_codon:yes stop_codon:yes gene_type:complete